MNMTEQQIERAGDLIGEAYELVEKREAHIRALRAALVEVTKCNNMAAAKHTAEVALKCWEVFQNINAPTIH